MKLLLAVTLLGVSTPEYPTYTSEVCMLTFTAFANATYEVHIGTEVGVYDIAIPVPLNRTAISCEDMGTVPRPVEVTYYRRVLARFPDGSVFYYADMPPMVMPAIEVRPNPPLTLSVMAFLAELFFD